MWEYTYSDELCHYGRKGMKWGQHIFMTPKQRKLNKQRKKNLEKARQARAKKLAEEKKHKEAFEKGRLSPRKMTDEELKKSLTRLETEKKYKEALLETRPVKRLMSKMWSDAVVPGLTKGGEELIKKAVVGKGSELLGLDGKKTESAYDKLKRDADTDKLKKQMFQDQRDLAEAQKRYNDHLAKERQEKAQKQVDEYNAKREKEYQDSRAGEPYRMKGAGSNKTKDSGQKLLESHSTTAVSTVVNRSNTNKGKSHVDNSNILNGKVTYDSDGTMHISYDDDDN